MARLKVKVPKYSTMMLGYMFVCGFVAGAWLWSMPW